MELKWIEDFLVLARTNNFTRAAEERNVTQSAFSRRIRALEMWLGQALIDRSTYPTRLTREGIIFKGIAEGVFSSLDDVRNDFHNRRPENVLTIATQHTLSLHFVPKWLSRMPPKVSNHRFRMLPGNFHDCVESINGGNCDLLVSFAHPGAPIELDPADFMQCVLGRDRMIPISAPGKDGNPIHRLPGKPREKTKFLAYDQGSFLGRALAYDLRDRNRTVHLDRRFENSLAESLKTMALESHGLAWIPYSCMAQELQDHRLVRAGNEAWDVALDVILYRPANNVNSAVRDIWDFARSDQVAPNPA